MINLTLTCKESKQILELGYDFTRACQNTYFRYEDLSRGGKFYRSHLHDIDTCLEFVLRRIRYLLKDTYDVFLESEGVIPVIPKAALLVTLPAFERTVVSEDYEHLSFAADSDFRLIYLKETHSGKTFKVFDSKEGKEPVFEAFIWCHENYPEELRKKFDEVINAKV